MPPLEAEHLRISPSRVDWIIGKEVQLEEPYFFGINTVTTLTAGKVAKVQQAYLRRYPAMKPTIDRLLGSA